MSEQVPKVESGITAVFTRNIESTKRVVVNKGGRGSSKSYSIAQLMINYLISQEGAKIGVCRKTFPALRRTCYALIITLLKEFGVYQLCQHDKTNHEILYKDSSWKKESRIDFFALDERTKIQSADFNYLWLEEAIEFDWEDYVVLSTSLRTPKPEGARNRMFLTLNPTDANSWIATRLVDQPDVEVVHSTYRDNPTVDDDYRNTLESLAFQDDNFYRVYTLGEWGRIENLILSKYTEVEQFPQGCKWVYGLDFGYTHPTSLVRVGQDENGKVYLDERFSLSKLTNADLIEKLSHEERADIYADSARPDMIEEILRAGYSIYPANKDVEYGLDLLRRQMLYITRESVNLWKEVRGYHHKKETVVDARGQSKEIISSKPFKFDDDAIDAARYGMCGLVARYGSAVSSHTYDNQHVIRTLTFAGELEPVPARLR